MAEVGPIGGDFTGKSLISVDQLVKTDVDVLMDETDAAAANLESNSRSLKDLLRGTLVVKIFYGHSTRTSSSFELAAKRLDANIISIKGPTSGEGLTKVVDDTKEYMDGENGIFVIRHPDQAQITEIAETAGVPVINAGAANGEHPTAALGDLTVLRNHIGDPFNLSVAMLGNLKTPTANSLARLLGMHQVAVIEYSSPAALKLPDEAFQAVDEYGVPQISTLDYRIAQETKEVVYHSDYFKRPKSEEDSTASNEWLGAACGYLGIDKNSLSLYRGAWWARTRHQPSEELSNIEQSIRANLASKMALLALVAGKSIQA